MFFLLIFWFQESGTPLEELLRLAFEGNHELKAYDHHVNAKNLSARYLAGWEDPSLSLRYYAEEVETRVGPQRYSLALQQNLPYPGLNRAKSALAYGQADILREEQRLKKARLARRISHAYFNLYYLQKKREIDRQNLHLMTTLEAATRSRFRTGDGSYAHVVQAQTQLANLTERLHTDQDALRAGEIEISALAGADKPLRILPIRLQAGAPPPAPVGQQPMLSVLDARIEERHMLDRLQRFDFKPQFKLSLTYIQTGDALNPLLPDSRKDPLIAGVGINLPVWKKKYRARLAQNRATVEAFEAEKQQAERELSAATEAERIRLESVMRKIALYEGTVIPQAALAMESAARAFRTGEVTFPTVIEAQRDLLQFKLTLERARADAFIHQAELIWLGAGQGLPTEVLP